MTMNYEKIHSKIILTIKATCVYRQCYCIEQFMCVTVGVD